MKIRISRFDPSADKESHIEEYEVDAFEKASILNILDLVHDKIDSTLSYRYCCKAGQCGSCAVRVNGEPALACMQKACENDLVEPLDLPVIKDLVTDIAPILAQLSWLNYESDACTIVKKDEIAEIKPLRECIECMSCISVCPAISASEYKGPTIMRQQQRLNLDPRDSSDRIIEAIDMGLFSCTTCKKCLEVCPKSIDTPGKAIEKLRVFAAKRGLSLPQHKALAALIEKTGRSVEKKGDTFLELVPDVIEPYGKVRATVGFFVGCMFNGRVVSTALDAMEVLKINGIRVIIPKTQVCCGSPLIRTGLIDIIPELKKRNIDAFVNAGVDTVLTICAGCGATLKNDYDTPFRVVDITEFFCEIGYKFPSKISERVFTYHDPCHLLRGQGISKQPREIIKNSVENFVDMPARCCGAGGGVKSGIPQEAEKIGEVRAEMVKKTGADCIITVCPFCEFHLKQSTGLDVRNIVSVMLEGYKKE